MFVSVEARGESRGTRIMMAIVVIEEEQDNRITETTGPYRGYLHVLKYLLLLYRKRKE